jgi:hypothetical protein
VNAVLHARRVGAEVGAFGSAVTPLPDVRLRTPDARQKVAAQQFDDEGRCHGLVTVQFSAAANRRSAFEFGESAVITRRGVKRDAWPETAVYNKTNCKRQAPQNSNSQAPELTPSRRSSTEHRPPNHRPDRLSAARLTQRRHQN